MRTVTIIWLMTIGGVYQDVNNSHNFLQEYLFVDLHDNYKVVTVEMPYSPNTDLLSGVIIIGATENIPLDMFLNCKDTTYDNPLKAFYYQYAFTINNPPTFYYEDDDDDAIPPQVIGKSAFCTPN
jgi:hypothetical protein